MWLLGLVLAVTTAQGIYGPIAIYNNSGPHPTKIIFDTDGVADDMRALTLALRTSTVQVIAITASHGTMQGDQVIANINRVLRANNITNVPIYKGARGPLLVDNSAKDPYFNGLDGLGDRPDAEPAARANDSQIYEKNITAAEAFVTLTKAHQDVTIVATGSLTNIALALKLDPDFALRPQKLVIMGGNYLGIGNSYSGQSTEWNFALDPEAASIVLAEMRIPVTVIPWEAYYIEGQKYAKSVNYTTHLTLGTPLANFFTAITEKGRKSLAETGSEMAYVDEIAMAVAINETAMVTDCKNLRVHVELAGKGQVVPDWVTRNFVEDTDQATTLSYIRFVTAYNATLLNEWMIKAFS
ncbi:unnamed protein product, partial [Mesorhabditis spiculigera]